MKKSPAILVVVLTIFFSFFSFVYWLPAKVNEQSAFFYQEPATVTLKDKAKTEKVSKELLDYVALERETNNSISDIMTDEEILAKIKEFETEMSPTRAEDLMGGRFGDSEFPTAYAETGLLSNAQDFAVPPALRDTVQFWINVFGVYDKSTLVIYNEDDVGIVYSVLDFSDLKSMDVGAAQDIRSRMTRAEFTRVQETLAKVSPLVMNQDGSESSLNDYERRILAVLRKNSDHVDVRLDALKKSLTSREGWSQRVRQAILASGRYMPEMRRIFAQQGLPTALTVLPFIESAFNLDAYSSAGAAGLWQFIRATGRNYLRIDDYVDERYDPILATYAAAAHLSREYKLFKNWPLTINGYNTGPGRVLQAMKQLKTRDIADVVRYYKGSGYGFDSRNYVPEFLAALEVYENREKYFGVIPEQREESYDYVKLDDDTYLPRLFANAGLDDTLMREFNRHVRDDVLDGRKKLPKGYLVKVPSLAREAVITAMNGLRRDDIVASYHVVGKGESLREIAAEYGITESDLRASNGLNDADRVRRGDIIKLPKLEHPPIADPNQAYSWDRPGEAEGDYDLERFNAPAGSEYGE